MPLDDSGRDDDFIDDCITITVDTEANLNRACNTMPLAIHFMCHAVTPDEPILRDDPLSLSKLAEEGRLSEVLTVLSWQFNLRT